MVNVPIEDEDALNNLGFEQVQCSDYDRIEVAETHCLARLSVMARRANQGETVAHFPTDKTKIKGDFYL